jgi:hypothetical protein
VPADGSWRVCGSLPGDGRGRGFGFGFGGGGACGVAVDAVVVGTDEVVTITCGRTG